MRRFQPDEPLIPGLATPSFVADSSPKTDVLMGPLGLRAGWGIALYLVLAFLLGLTLFLGLFKATGQYGAYRQRAKQTRDAALQAKASHKPPPVQVLQLPSTATGESAQTGAVLLAALAMSFWEQRRFGVYGLGLRSLRNLFPGAGVGLVAIAGLVGLLRAMHLVVFDRRLLGGAEAVRYGVAWLLVFLLVGLSEEFLFRGYLQFTLMRGLLRLGARVSATQARAAAFSVAAAIWSVSFSLMHLGNAGEDPMGLVMVFAAGVLFSYALWRTGSLWWGIGFHMTWDWGQSFLFGVPDSGGLSAGRLFSTHATGPTFLSGGSAGPEGSVLVLPVLLLVGLVLRWYPAGVQPPVEPERLPRQAGRVSADAIS